MLIILSGLPGVGKTTLGRALAVRLDATLVRVDGIEHALALGGVSPIEGLGYEIAHAVALENLTLGRTVVADTVNPWELTREAWREVALKAGLQPSTSNWSARTSTSIVGGWSHALPTSMASRCRRGTTS